VAHCVRDSYRGALATTENGKLLQARGIYKFFKVLGRPFE
jgi:hypothetical protein